MISDFQHGTINDAEIACVPPDVGLRFVQIANDRAGSTSATLVGLPADGRTTDQRVEFEGPRTRVTFSAREAGAALQPRILAPPDHAPAVAGLLRAAARAGTPALPADRPMTFIFSGVPTPAAAPLRVPWMIAALVAAREDAALVGAAISRRDAKVSTLSAAWTPVVRSATGEAAGLGGRGSQWSDGLGVGGAFRRVVACRGARVPRGWRRHAELGRARSGSHPAVATEGVDARRRADPGRALQAHATRGFALALGTGTGAACAPNGSCAGTDRLPPGPKPVLPESGGADQAITAVLRRRAAPRADAAQPSGRCRGAVGVGSPRRWSSRHHAMSW